MGEQQPTLPEVKNEIEKLLKAQTGELDKKFQKVYKFLEYIADNTDDVRASIATMREHFGIPVNSLQWKSERHIKKQDYVPIVTESLKPAYTMGFLFWVCIGEIC